MDELLRKLADAPVPPGVPAIDDAVVAILAAQRHETRATLPLVSAAALVALGIGYVGGSFVATPASAPESSFGLAEAALAPSTLLDFL